jgi:hypothetical protein
MADDLITLPEYAKSQQDPVVRGMVETFARQTDFMEVMPFKSAAQGKYAYDREAALPGIAFRAINEEPEVSHGVINELVEQCYPMSGLLQYDRIKMKRYGEGRRARELEMQMKAASAEWANTFIDGDNRSDPREFSGMKARLAGISTTPDSAVKENRVIVNNNSSGGGPLSLKALDIAIELVPGANAILMNRRLRTLFTQAERDIDLTGHVIQTQNEGGRPVTRYAGIPIFIGYEPDFHDDLFPFTEVGNGGGSAVTSSIYVVRFGDGYVCGLQTSGMEVIDVGHTDRGVFHRDLVEWDSGMCIEHPYAAMRLSSITNAAIVA